MAPEAPDHSQPHVANVQLEEMRLTNASQDGVLACSGLRPFDPADELRPFDRDLLPLWPSGPQAPVNPIANRWN